MTNRRREISRSGLKEYATLVAELKERIHSAQTRASRSVSRELIALYWDIGKAIVQRQKKLGWGKSVVEKLATDLRAAFPEQKGFSSQNLWFMRQCYEELNRHPNLLQLARELPWWHIITVITKTKKAEEREYYFRAALAYGWPRSLLTHHIETVVSNC